MIRVARSRYDENGYLIQPNNEWIVRARRATEELINQPAPRIVDPHIYGHAQVKMALEALFFGKCAYCETFLDRVDWEVEHFRPKGRVAEREDHPGYYWLGYKWENLFPSCTLCNQHRKARPVWGGDPGVAGGKADRFPLSSEATRAMVPGQKTQENRLLLDPCRDYPEKHFVYTLLGEVLPYNNSRKAAVSIDVFNLSEPRLRHRRRAKIAELSKLAAMRVSLVERDNPEAVELVDKLIAGMGAREKDLAGLARYFRNNPNVFGVQL